MARILCAHCKTTHASVAEVRTCANDEAEARWEAQQEAAAARFWEEGTEAQSMRYRDEVEQDERNAAFWAGPFTGFDGQLQGHPPIWR